MHMDSSVLDANSSYLRHRALGSTALYKVLSDSDGIVTVSVVSAPGLESGTRVRLLARVAETMERHQVVSASPARTRFSRERRGFAGSLVSR
jgi:hypothetical protein